MIINAVLEVVLISILEADIITNKYIEFLIQLLVADIIIIGELNCHF